jgi:hypothetical protein
MSARIRTGSRLKRFLCFVLIDVRYLSVPSGIRLSQVQYHWFTACGIIVESLLAPLKAQWLLYTPALRYLYVILFHMTLRTDNEHFHKQHLSLFSLRYKLHF